MGLTRAALLLACMAFAASYSDIPCQWRSKTGSTFDLQPLTLTDQQASYLIKDGDIPCTPEKEPSYDYVWNFCADVTQASFPSICSDLQAAAAIQYIDRADGYQECNVIGLYDTQRDDTYFQLLDEADPSKGVSMKYLFGHRCPTTGKLRTATVNVACANVQSVIDSADEPTPCDYELNMRSLHGCPLECPITPLGLCNSHGHCAYDPTAGAPRCYCNHGFGGKECQVSGLVSDYQYTAEIVLLALLLTAVLCLTCCVAYLAYRITQFRAEQMSSYALLGRDFEGTEMVPSMRH